MLLQKTEECITADALSQLLKESEQKIFIIDVRNPEEFAEKHIPAAINMPLYDLSGRSTAFSKSDTIITVCGKGGGRSARAAEQLKQTGFVHAIYLCGGSFAWFDAR